MEGLLDVIRREVFRVLARHTRETAGIVTGWDPKAHAVKVKLQPEGVETGWIPLRTLQTGSSHGLHIAPSVGDPLAVAFHEDDREAGTIMGAFFTDKHPPVEVKEGEYLYRHKSKAEFYFKEDGTVWIKGKGGDTSVLELKSDGSISIRRGTAEIGITTSDHVFVTAPKTYIGGGDGVGSRVMTEDGPSPYLYAKVS